MTPESPTSENSSSDLTFLARHHMSTPNKYRESPPNIKSPEEDILASREKTLEVRIGRGVTNSSFIELKDDGKAVFKTVYFENERAAYLIDRFLGFNLTPPTAIRVLDGQIGSAQEFIPNAKAFFEFDVSEINELEKSHRLEFMKMWIFDIIIGNEDRHGGNLICQGESIFAIDHGHSITIHGSEFVNIIRVSYAGYTSFFDEDIPLEIVQPIKNFLDTPKEQNILLELLTELYDHELASACIKRIRIIGELLIRDGRITNENSVIEIK